MLLIINNNKNLSLNKHIVSKIMFFFFKSTVSTWTSGTAVGSDAAVAVTGADARSSGTLSLISGGSLGRKQESGEHASIHPSVCPPARPSISLSVCLSDLGSGEGVRGRLTVGRGMLRVRRSGEVAESDEPKVEKEE